jgi:hypothetical protein
MVVVAATQKFDLTLAYSPLLCSDHDHIPSYMLTPKARQLLRCKAYTRFGRQCRAYIIAGLEVCISHSPWRSRGPGSTGGQIRPGRCACRCAAYKWPHRRGSGVCCWPDPPNSPCATPSGTRRSSNLKDLQRVRMTSLNRLSTISEAFPKTPVRIQPSAYCASVVGPPRRRV